MWIFHVDGYAGVLEGVAGRGFDKMRNERPGIWKKHREVAGTWNTGY